MMDLWGAGPGDIWAVGFDGSILHHGGGLDWDPALLLPGIHWQGIWGAAADTVFAVGSTEQSTCCPGHRDVGVVYRFAEGQWSQVVGLQHVAFNAVWGAAGDDVYAVGNANPEMVLLHGDADGWHVVADSLVAASHKGTAVWGSSAHDVFVAGTSNGAAFVLHFDGSAWRLQETPGEHIMSLWGTGPDEVYAADRSGQILRFDGTQWASVAAFDRPLLDVFGFATGEVFACGRGLIVEKLGEQWAEMAIDTPRFQTGSGPYEYYTALWGAAPERLYCSGHVRNVGAASSSSFMLVLDGGRWRFQQPPAGATIQDMWGVSASEVYAVGKLSAVLRYDGVRWLPLPMTGLDTWPAADGVGEDFLSVWAGGPDDILAGTYRSLWHFDGASWTESRPFAGAQDMWGVAEDDLYAIEHRNSMGSGPYAVMHFDGASWQEVGALAAKPLLLHGLDSGAIVAAGYGGSCRLWDGTAWAELGPVGGVSFAAWGNELEGLYIGGYESSQIHRHVDGVWCDVEIPARSYSVRLILGNAADDLHLLSDRDTGILRFDGSEWNVVSREFLAVRGGWSGEGTLFAGGYGRIYHRDTAAP